jgi:hypothetical protein
VKSLRRIHTYLGCFFAPLLLFFILSGWYQTVTPNRQKGTGELGDWKARLTSVHVDSIYPSESANSYSPRLFRLLVVIMAGALIITLLLGVVMAVRFTPKKWAVWMSLALGSIMPVFLLWLGQKR